MKVAEDRKALITGGASGFGREIARTLHAAGAAAAVVDLDAERAEETAAELGDGAIGIGADVRSAADVRAAVDRAVEGFGGLDTLVVSAGVFHMGDLDEVSEEDWDRTLDVNLKGAFLATQAAMPYLRASGRGRVVMISSDAGKRGFAALAPYTASKFGLNGLMESVAAEVAADNVTVNTLCPVGCPTTGMGQEVLAEKIKLTGDSPEAIMARAAATNPLGRNVVETDVADAVLFLVSEHSSFITGVALDVDGGASLGSVPGVATT
jgi:NAD(P)-dependent dehydrogenase (short-subunit alcohol dehydrogenase family)